ncbi:MAG: ATP synthase F1 subunit gamma [Candidatus Omnitrophota bacterium]|nr:MAG: ATP synthase F1 subunit gamma [Candidatus Omnitrophota bacterium]
MAEIRSIKDKMVSIEKIKRITNAMQIVALTRLRKMEHQTLDTRAYFDKIRELLFGISQTTNFNMHPLLAERPKETPPGAVVLGSDKGLCGNFNGNIINKILKLKSDYPDEPLKIVAAGRKIIKYISARDAFTTLAAYSPIDYETLPAEVGKMTGIIIDEFLHSRINSLFLIYNEFKRHIMGEAKVVRLLPLALEAPKKLPHHRNYIYEPEPRNVFDKLLEEYIANQIHHAVLESRTAEEMARMLAMKTATDNADKIIKKLALSYHKARQATITAELMDVVGAAEEVA